MQTIVRSALASILALLASQAFAQDVPALLKAADKYRMSSENMQVDTLIAVFNTDGSPDKERRYLPLQDDLASVAFWYQTLPTSPLKPLPDRDYLEVI